VTDADAFLGIAGAEIDAGSGERTVYLSLANCHRLEATRVPPKAIRQASLILAGSYESEVELAMRNAGQGTSCRSVSEVEAAFNGIWR